MENGILLLVERTVQVIIVPFVVAGSREDPLRVQGSSFYDGGDGVIEVEGLPAGNLADGVGQKLRSQGTRSDDGDTVAWEFRDFFPDDGNQRVGFQCPGDLPGKDLPIYG